MTLNHRKSIKNFISLLCIATMKHTVGIQKICDLMSCTTPACFSTFFQSNAYGP